MVRCGKKRKGFTLAEIMLVVALIGIIASVVAVSMNKYFANQKIDKCENELKIMINDFNSYIIDYGNLAVDPSSADYDNEIKAMLDEYNTSYASYMLDIDNIDIKEDSGLKVSVNLETKTKLDPWGEKYVIDINTDLSSTLAGTIVVHSKGPDNYSAASTYKDGNMEDDIVLIIYPKSIE